MSREHAEIVICGAGIAGIAAAYELAVERGISDVLLVDDRPPLTLTSDKSTECYRTWWPQPAMARLVASSVDRLDALAAKCNDAFALNRHGYAYLTADAQRTAALLTAAEEASQGGLGPLRIHRESGETPYASNRFYALDTTPRGLDLTLDAPRILARYPFLSPDVRACLHVRRAGWLDAQQLGMYLLERSREQGVRLHLGRCQDIQSQGGQVTAVRLTSAAGEEVVSTSCVVAAPGPLLPAFAAACGFETPVVNELHGKVTFEDTLGLVPRDLPLMIWGDPVRLAWSVDESQALAEDPELSWLLGELPGGVHFRPEGGAGSTSLLLLWAFRTPSGAAQWPPRFPPYFAEIVVRGVARMVPGFAAYLDRMPRLSVDGGYYCKTPDLLPLVGPTDLSGLFLFAGLAGYGIMAAVGAAQLIADHVAGGTVPSWAKAFLPQRFADPTYLDRLAAGGHAGGEL